MPELHVVKPNPPRLIRAKATNTRYMGVVGMLTEYALPGGETITELFHLDYETYGVDGYERYSGVGDRSLESDIQRVMGGLGGTFVSLTNEEVLTLIQSAVAVAPECVHDYPDAFALDPRRKAPIEAAEDIRDHLYVRLLPEIDRLEGWVNYFLMRTIGHDWEARRALWTEPAKDQAFRDITDQEQTLIRNQTALVEHQDGQWVWRCTSLIDVRTRYRVLVSEITLTDQSGRMRISEAKMIEELSVSTLEAAMQLRKREHLSVYAVLDDDFDTFFEQAYPQFMVNDHEAGRLYCEFNPDNRHVEASTYYLNGDLFAVYYLTDDGQLVVSTFDDDKLEQVEGRFAGPAYREKLEPVGSFIADTPILYDFVYSGLGNFYEFLNEEDE